MSLPCLLLLAATAITGDDHAPAAPARDPLLLGEGAHTYRWQTDWPRLADGTDLGNTHGDIAIDAAGLVYFNTDTEQAVMVFRQDGTFVRSFGAEFQGGLHGMALAREGDQQVLFIVHTGLHQIAKLSLTGEVLWRRGFPAEAKVYENGESFRPTGIAIGPAGQIFVSDGYGLSYVHEFGPDGTWVRTFGGGGTDDGRFRVCHGLTVDHRSEPPTLVIADRENSRLQRFDLEGQFVGVFGKEHLRRPCKVVQQGDYLLVPDLAGRVTILGKDDELICQLGDNPDPALRAQNGVARAQWHDGVFLSPHSAAWDKDGNLYVMDWNFLGRMTRLERIRATGDTK